MPATYGRRGSWVLLGVGGLAAACGALAWYRFRSRPHSNTEDTPAIPRHPSIAASGPADRDWLPDAAPDGSSPGGLSPIAEAEAGSPPGSEPWLEPLRLAMERSPHAFGYGKSAWTAPLLARYLQDTHGIEVPLPVVRKALKDLGYRWEHTRYVQARAGAVQDGFTSDGMG